MRAEDRKRALERLRLKTQMLQAQDRIDRERAKQKVLRAQFTGTRRRKA